MRELILFVLFASISIGQPISNQFVGCDYYQTLELNQWHDVFSPRFPQNYPPNTFCRWTACAPYGSVIVVNCTVMRIPSSQYCSSDRLEVSLAGCQDLNDGATYCSNTPFVSVSKTNALVMALKTASNTMGGSFFCQIQARQNAISAQAVTPQARFPITPANSYPMPVLPSNQAPQRPNYQPYQPPQQPYRPAQQQQAMAPIYYPPNSANIVSQPNRGNVFPVYNGPSPNGPVALQPFPVQPAQPYQSLPFGSQPYGSQPYGSQPFGSQPYYQQQDQARFQPSPAFQPSPMFQPSPIQQVMPPSRPQPISQPFQPSSQRPYTFPLQQPQPYPVQYQRPMYQPPLQSPYSSPQRPVYQPMAAHPSYAPQCQCGLRKRPRIVGGVTTDVNEFPFMCGIMDMTTKRVICGCTIIHEQYVITSAHCVVNQSLSDMGCVVGAQDYVTQSSSPYTSIYRFAGFIPYPSFDPTSLVNDIAIMRIYGSMQFNPGVSAVCLPISDRLNQNTFVYSQAEAVGWGKTSYGGPVSTNLQKVELTVIPNSECNKNYPYQISTAQMCTFSPMKDICDFDDGGPLLFTDTLTGRSFLIGLFSYGVACASRMARVLSRMTNYLSWVLATTNGTANYCIV